MTDINKVREKIAEAWGVDVNNGPSEDQLQNELILIKHHVEDARTYLKEGETPSVLGSLKDIDEAIDRLAKFLRPKSSAEIFRMSDEH